MSDFDNIFGSAMSCADARILDVMGTEAKMTSGILAGSTITGVFDDPENTGYAGTGIRVEGSSPSLFVKTASAVQLQRLDTMTIGGGAFWVDRIGTDDGGSCHIWLGKGRPPASGRRTVRAGGLHERS